MSGKPCFRDIPARIVFDVNNIVICDTYSPN